MAVRIVRLGTPRQRGEGVRLGTVRRPPRGVPKTEYARRNWYDVWLPNLSPSAPLMQRMRSAEDAAAFSVLARHFRTELKSPDAAHLLDALAALSRVANFSVGCYCEDERRCHRSVLRSELAARGATLA
jgi:uncharacterized protein YeaO (DUF488 family)